MSEEEINEALKIIKEPITVNSIEYKYFNQENYEKLLSVYENAKWFVSNWEQALQNIKDLQQKVEQLEKELTLMVEDDERSQGTIIKQSKRIEQLENIRKEAIDYVYKHIQEYDVDGTFTNLDEFDFIASPQTLLNILNKGDNNGK